MRRRLFPIIAVVMGAPFFVASCVCGNGADSPTPTATPAVAVVPVDQFISAVCTPWNAYYSHYLELFNGFVGSENLSEHKERLVAQVTEIEQLSRALVAAAPTLPRPDGPSGAEVRQLFVDVFLREQRTFATFLEGVKTLDPGDAGKFQDQLNTLNESVPDNDLEERLGALGPSGVDIVNRLDAEPNDCALIMIAF